MKRHIVRSMETDRYGFTVPTKLSELENDISGPTGYRLRLTGTREITGAAPVNAVFSMTAGVWTGAPNGSTFATGVTVAENSGFTLPGAGDLIFDVPVTGLYAITVSASWRSTVDTIPATGYAVTNYTLGLSTGVSPSIAANFSGVAGVDNKVGLISMAPGVTSIQTSGIFYLTAATVLTVGTSILSEAPALPATGLLANIDMSIVRIA